MRSTAERQFKEVSAAYSALQNSWSDAGSENAATSAGGSYYRYSAAYSKAESGSSQTFSNGLVAAVLSAPLVLLGFWMERKSSYTSTASGASEEMKIRPYGFFHPPVNPYLRDDLHPKTMKRKPIWGAWQEETVESK